MNENKLIDIAKPYLDNCRSGDWNHALRVVKWVKILGKDRDDINLLITAAYVHDIGWFKVLPNEKLDLDKMLNYEEQANNNTEKLVREVLIKLEFSENHILNVIRLINAADKHTSEQDDEAIIVDSDSLSKLCVDHVKEKYTPESYKKIINLWEKKFPKRFKTKKGKSIYPELLEKLKKEILYQ